MQEIENDGKACCRQCWPSMGHKLMKKKEE